MNKHLFLSVIFSFGLLFSACSDKSTNKDQRSEFFMHGKVINGANKKLQLNVPSLYPNNILESTIKNGYYSFKGSFQSQDIAYLSIADHESDFAPLPIFITEDTLEVFLELDKRDKQWMIAKDSTVKGNLNQYAKNIATTYWEINGVWVFKDSLKNDSMQKNIYPDVRRKTFELYEETLFKKQKGAVGLHYLRMMLEDNVVYDKKRMPLADREHLRMFFEQIDTSLRHTADYKIVNNYIDTIDDTSGNQEFVEYTLLNLASEEKSLSQIIAKNNFTLVEFWYSGCPPCRKFNKEGKLVYEELKKAGIEIVSINTDYDQSIWQKASKQDSIPWINLYAGIHSEIVPNYNVTSYPTSYIFDKNQQLIAFSFKEARDLLKLNTAE